MATPDCEFSHNRPIRARVRVQLSWYNRSTQGLETEEVDLCATHAENKRREFGPNPGRPGGFPPPIRPRYREIKHYR